MTTMEPEPDAQPRPARGVPRRTAITAGAWAVPVITAAIAAPAAAASTPDQVELLNAVFEDVEIGDQIPLVFSVTGVDEGASATATIVSGAAVAEWASGDTVEIATVDGGETIFIATVLAAGEFIVNLSIGGYSGVHTIFVTTA